MVLFHDTDQMMSTMNNRGQSIPGLKKGFSKNGDEYTISAKGSGWLKSNGKRFSGSRFSEANDGQIREMQEMTNRLKSQSDQVYILYYIVLYCIILCYIIPGVG